MIWIHKIAEIHFFTSLWDLIVLIPVIVVFHYCMYHTNFSYKNSKLVSDWVGIALILIALAGITFYYI